MKKSDYNIIGTLGSENSLYPKLLFSGGSVSVLLSSPIPEEFDAIIEPQVAFGEGTTTWVLRTQSFGSIYCRVTVAGGGASVEFLDWVSNTGTFFDTSMRYGRELFPEETQIWPLEIPGSIGDNTLHLNPGVEYSFNIASDSSNNYYETLSYDESTSNLTAPVSMVDFGDYYLLGPIVPNGDLILGGTPEYVKFFKLDKQAGTGEIINAAAPEVVSTSGGAITSLSLGGSVFCGMQGVMYFDAETNTVSSLPTPTGDFNGFNIYAVRENVAFLYGYDDNTSSNRFFLVEIDGENTTYYEITTPVIQDPSSYAFPLGTLFSSSETHLYLTYAYTITGTDFIFRIDKVAFSDLSTVVDFVEIPFDSLTVGLNDLQWIENFHAIANGDNLFISYRYDNSEVTVIEFDSALDIINREDLADLSTQQQWIHIAHVTDEYVYVVREDGVGFIDRSDFTLSSINFEYVFSGLDESTVRGYIIDSGDNLFVPSSATYAFKIHPVNGVLPMKISGGNGRFFDSSSGGDLAADFTPDEDRIWAFDYTLGDPTTTWHVVELVPGVDGGGEAN